MAVLRYDGDLESEMGWGKGLVRRKIGPLGLRNLGNSCYLNSVLQCLTYTPPLALFCLKKQHSSLCDSVNLNQKQDCAFCILEKWIHKSLTVELAMDAPSKIQSSLHIFAKPFQSGRQEDAHEFLRYVIDACQNTCLKLLREKNKAAERGGEVKANSTIVKEIFGGVLQSQVKCLSCNMESNTLDDIMDISLDVYQSTSLKDALRRFFQPEVLDGSNKYKCDKCKKLTAARKQMSIFRAPYVLVIQLKRFEGIHSGKIDRAIAFEESLELSAHMCKAGQDLQPEYSLFGIIVHSGYSQDSGHYYAYVKDATGRWFCCNDSHVSVATTQDVLSEKVYILFFIRTNQGSKSRKSGFASIGVKPSVCNGNGTSVSQKLCEPVEPPANRPSTAKIYQKYSSPCLETGKVLLKPQIKFANLKPAASESQRSDANGKVIQEVYNRASIEKHVNSKESTVSVAKENLPSSIHLNANGNRPADSSPEIKNTFFSGSVDDQKVNECFNKSNHIDHTDKVSVGEDKGVVSKNSHYGNGNYHCDRSVSKRKSHDNSSADVDTSVSNSCSSSKHDAGGEIAIDSCRKMDLAEYKQMLARVGRSDLLSCGWCDEVRDFMRARKKLCRGSASSITNSVELKKMLVAEAKEKFIPLVPNSVKERLIGSLQMFSWEKQ
ncbi:hypothetical protein AMTRI_Chr02g211570 [Amborella trichopoda]